MYEKKERKEWEDEAMRWLADAIRETASAGNQIPKKATMSFKQSAINTIGTIDDVISAVLRSSRSINVIRVGKIRKMLKKKNIEFTIEPTVRIIIETNRIIGDIKRLIRIVEYL